MNFFCIFINHVYGIFNHKIFQRRLKEVTSGNLNTITRFGVFKNLHNHVPEMKIVAILDFASFGTHILNLNQ